MNNKKRQFLLQILIGEIEYHVKSAKKVYLEYLAVRKQLTIPVFIKESFENERSDVGDAFRHLHSFLTHCVLICNILFPIHANVECIEDRDKKKKVINANKRKTLRKNLLKQYLKKGGSLDSLRAIRNRFEHFDEDLDEWIATTKHTIFMTRNIFTGTNLSKAIKIGDISTGEVEEQIRPFAYIEDNTLKYWGKQYDIDKAYDELVKLEQEIEQLERNNR